MVVERSIKNNKKILKMLKYADLYGVLMPNDLFRKTKIVKNIILFTDTVEIGGAEEYMKKLAISLNNYPFNIRLAIPKRKYTQDFVNELILIGIGVDFISKYYILNNLFYFRRNKPDFIHFNMPYPTKCMTAILAGIIHSKSKLYVTEHLVPPEFKPHPFIRLIKKFIYTKLDLSITVSKKNKEVLVKNFDLPENKIKVIYNCIDIDHIKNYRSEIVKELKHKFSINNSSLVFGTVARLDDHKGHEYLINASKEVIKEVPESVFLFVGQGKLKDQLIQKIKDNDLSEHFRIVGFQEDLPEILALIDIFVLPSVFEGFPFSILEAMAARKPVIATNVGGVPEIITNNVNGILVEPKDPDALSRAMILLAKDKEKRDHFAGSGYQTIIENFSLEKMISKTKAIYK